MAKFASALSWLMRLTILAIGMYNLADGAYFSSLLFVIAFLVSLFPLLINALYDVQLHWIFELSFSLIMLWHMLGFLGLYDMISLWDDFGHIWGGATFALIGFAWIYSMNVSGRIKTTLPMTGLISVMWSVTAGVVWEIWEFIWDSAHGLVNVYGLAQNGLIDTMTDLSNDLIAAIIMALLCIYFVRHFATKTQNKIINPFVEILEKKKA